MESGQPQPEGVTRGDGYALAHLDQLGEGPGFRKVRQALGVTAFGVNAIVIPAGVETAFHYHDLQEELYFVYQGELEMEFGDGSVHRLPQGTFVRVDAQTHRRLRNRGPEEAIYVCVGGKDGYIGRDGRRPEGEGEERVRPLQERSEG